MDTGSYCTWVGFTQSQATYLIHDLLCANSYLRSRLASQIDIAGNNLIGNENSRTGATLDTLNLHRSDTNYLNHLAS